MLNERDYWTLDAMDKWGGSFVKQLATLCRHADKTNFEKIKKTWPEYWAEYEKKGFDLEADEIREADNH